MAKKKARVISEGCCGDTLDELEEPSFNEVVQQAFLDADRYQHEVARQADRLGPESPEFALWCAEMDAWNLAVQKKV